jgi:Spy/CpxP family protein refolding chaperone
LRVLQNFTPLDRLFTTPGREKCSYSQKANQRFYQGSTSLGEVMKWNSKILAAILALTLVGAVAVAQQMRPAHMHRDGMFGGSMLGFFGDYLDLTDAQRAQIKQIMAKERATRQPMWQQERQSHEAMMQLITSGNFDEAKAQTIAQQATQVQAQLMVEHARTASQAYQVLTADQKTKLAQFLAKRQQRFAEHMKEHSESQEAAPNQ